MRKKAVELSLNAVIIAAIALIVLVVIVIIFTSYSGKFVHGLDDCKAKGGNPGNCKDTAALCVDAGGIPSGSCVYYNDATGEKITNKQSQVCCVFRK